MRLLERFKAWRLKRQTDRELDILIKNVLAQERRQRNEDAAKRVRAKSPDEVFGWD